MYWKSVRGDDFDIPVDKETPNGIRQFVRVRGWGTARRYTILLEIDGYDRFVMHQRCGDVLQALVTQAVRRQY